VKNLDIDLKLLELFCCVYEKGSISESSDCLHLSQSTISFHLHQLENQIGLKLFYKKGRKLIPTSTAQMLYPYAKKVLELKFAVIEEIKMLSGSYRGLVKVGASSVPGSYILPDFISDFLSKNRHIMIEFYVSDSKEVVDKIAKGELDLGVVGAKIPFSRLKYENLWWDQIHIVGGNGVDPRLSLEDLKTLPWVLREEGSGTRRLIEEALYKLGIDLKELKILMITDKNEVILDVLKKVKALSFMSSLALRKYKGIRQVKVKGFEPIEREFYLVFDEERPLPPAVRYFVEELKRRSFVEVSP
jgi:DNA-binding transcriptional LysR family regulator